MERLKRTSSPPLFCLVCGVDSGPIRNFLFLFIGCLVGASVLWLVWAIVTRRLDDSRELSEMALTSDRRETEKTRE